MTSYPSEHDNGRGPAGDQQPAPPGDAADVEQMLRGDVRALAAAVEVLAHRLGARGLQPAQQPAGHHGPCAPAGRPPGAGDRCQPAADTGLPVPGPGRLVGGEPGGDRGAGSGLDADLAGWYTPDGRRPRIGILGQVSVQAPGQAPTERRRFYTELVVYLALQGARGATPAELEQAIWDRGITASSRRVALSRARRWLGHTPAGHPWLPPAGPDQLYRLASGYLLDWDLFCRLRARGLQHGARGAEDLRHALELVRGAPFDRAEVARPGSPRTPYAWLTSVGVRPEQLASVIVETAGRLVDLCLETGDIGPARWADDLLRQTGLDRPTEACGNPLPATDPHRNALPNAVTSLPPAGRGQLERHPYQLPGDLLDQLTGRPGCGR
jgi:hypothetical protein